MKALVLSNLNPLTDPVTFTSENGTWNVSRALRDCAAKQHRAYLIDVAAAHAANSGCTVDEALVRSLMLVPTFQPCIGVMEGGVLWLIDGHHRLRAAHRRGDKEIACYVIEEEHAARYRVLFDGERIAPIDVLKLLGD